MDELKTPDHIFDCQEYMGKFFLHTVADEMMGHRKSELGKAAIYNNDLFHTDKGSVLNCFVI